MSHGVKCCLYIAIFWNQYFPNAENFAPTSGISLRSFLTRGRMPVKIPYMGQINLWKLLIFDCNSITHCANKWLLLSKILKDENSWNHFHCMRRISIKKSYKLLQLFIKVLSMTWNHINVWIISRSVGGVLKALPHLQRSNPSPGTHTIRGIREYDSKLYPGVRLQFWSSEEYGSLFHWHHFHVHSDLE